MFIIWAFVRVDVSLHHQLHDRLRPWHGLMLAAFFVGAGVSLVESTPDLAAVSLDRAFLAVLSGLFAVVVFQFTVGNVWGYAVEYVNAGGSWTDPPFLAPFALAGVAGVAAGAWTGEVAVGAWAAFWAFVVGSAVVAVGAWVAVGYRESSG